MSGSVGIRLDGLKARRLIAGDGTGYTITRLAQLANVSEWLIKSLEDGGNCMPDEAQRILDGLAKPNLVGVVTGGNPTTCLLSTLHTFRPTDTIVISGVLGSDPDVNGAHVVTSLIGAFILLLDFDTTGGFPGTGGVARLDGASVGLSRL